MSFAAERGPGFRSLGCRAEIREGVGRSMVLCLGALHRRRQREMIRRRLPVWLRTVTLDEIRRAGNRQILPDSGVVLEVCDAASEGRCPIERTTLRLGVRPRWSIPHRNCGGFGSQCRRSSSVVVNQLLGADATGGGQLRGCMGNRLR